MNTEKKIDRKEMFSSFIKSLSHQTAITGEIIAKELLAIFEITGISESAAHNWLTKSNQGFIKHFRSKNLTQKHYEKCIEYFNNMIGLRFELVQKDLEIKSTLFKYVDFYTLDCDIFFCSLLKQFLYIVDVPITNNSVLISFIDNIKSNKNTETTFKSKATFDSQDVNTQMCHIFLNAINQFKIAYYIDNLKLLFDFCDLEYADNNFVNSIFAFKDYIDLEILGRFITYQDSATYTLIKEFNDLLFNFCHCFQILQPSIAEEFSNLYIPSDKTDYFFSLCQSEFNEVENNIKKVLENGNSNGKEEALNILKQRKSQIGFLITILSNHSQLCSLFEKLSGGKSLLIHTVHEKQ